VRILQSQVGVREAAGRREGEIQRVPDCILGSENAERQWLVKQAAELRESVLQPHAPSLTELVINLGQRGKSGQEKFYPRLIQIARIFCVRTRYL